MHFAMSDLGLQCLPLFHFLDAKHKSLMQAAGNQYEFLSMFGNQEFCLIKKNEL